MDVLLTIISAVCTVASIGGAVSSILYWKKSQSIIKFAKSKTIEIEITHIQSKYIELLDASNPNKIGKGRKVNSLMSPIATEMKKSYVKITEILSSDQVESFNLDCKSSMSILDSIIDGSFMYGNMNCIQTEIAGFQFKIKKISEQLESKLK